MLQQSDYNRPRTIWFAVFPNTVSSQIAVGDVRKRDMQKNGILYDGCPAPELLKGGHFTWGFGRCAETFVFL